MDRVVKHLLKCQWALLSGIVWNELTHVHVVHISRIDARGHGFSKRFSCCHNRGSDDSPRKNCTAEERIRGITPREEADGGESGSELEYWTFGSATLHQQRQYDSYPKTSSQP